MSERKTMIIGLTGQTGAGKSTLSRMFSEWGVEVIDADKVARYTIENSKECLMDLVLEFSTEVIHPDATLNRPKLAEICFGDKKKLKRLNEITFPYIIRAIGRKLEEACGRGVKMVLLDAPTLYESGLDKRCDRVVAVIADAETRTRRIIERDKMTEEDARRRVNAQNNDAFYTSRADDILTNDGELGALRLVFIDLFNRYEKLANEGGFDKDGSERPQAREAASPDAPGEMPDALPSDKEVFGELAGEDSD